MPTMFIPTPPPAGRTYKKKPFRRSDEPRALAAFDELAKAGPAGLDFDSLNVRLIALGFAEMTHGEWMDARTWLGENRRGTTRSGANPEKYWHISHATMAQIALVVKLDIQSSAAQNSRSFMKAGGDPAAAITEYAGQYAAMRQAI